MKTPLLATLFLTLSANALAADSLAFASGEPKKGYSKLFANINDVCNATVPLQEINTNGGLDNLTALADKTATVGISQVDTWQSLMSGDEAIGRLKAVVSLNSNLMHILVSKNGYVAGRRCTGKEVLNKCLGGEWQNIGKVIEKETDLNGLTVAAVGSAQVFARTYLNKKLNLNLNIQDVDAQGGKAGDARALDMLKSGQVQAVLTMGAYPSGPVGALKASDEVTLAAFSQAASSGYKVVKKNYKNLGVFNQTFLAIPNILWARPVDPNGAVGKQITALKTCISANLRKMQDETGYEASWADATLALPDDVIPWSGVAKKK